MAEDAAIF